MAFPTTSVLHAFTGTNGTDLNVYSADYQSAPTGANPMEIQGNAATGSVNTAYNANFLATSYGPDSENFITVTTLPSTGYPVLLPIRCVNETSMATLDGYCLYYVDTSLSVQRIDNGVLTQLGSAATQTISTGDSIGIECQSSSHRMYYKASGGSWGQVGSTQTDSTYSAAGKIGLYSYGTTVRLDDHGGGTLSATQTLTPSLVTNTQTFHAPTVGRGAVTLTPSLVTNSQTFYGPTVSSSYGLTPSLVTNSQTFYGPTVSAGAVNLTPGLFSNTNAFYAAIVTADGGGQALLPGRYDNSQTFYAGTVTPGAVTITPSLVTNTNTFFAAIVDPGAVTLTPALLSNTANFYAATVGVGEVTLSPNLVASTPTFYAATVVAGPVEIAPGLFSNTNTFYAATVASGSTQTLVADRFDNAADYFFLPTVVRAPLTDAQKLAIIYKILANRQQLDPTTGTFRLYDDDDVTILYEVNAWEDAAGTIPYRGRGLRRLDALE